jgi:hypothetical protein
VGEVFVDEWEDVRNKYNLSFGAGFIWLVIGSTVEFPVRRSEHLDCLKVSEAFLAG